MRKRYVNYWDYNIWLSRNLCLHVQIYQELSTLFGITKLSG